jgi:hypothetical protein
MNYEKKRKIKKWFKARWKFLLGSGIFLAVGVVVMLVGFSVTGWSIVKWLHSPFATTTIISVIGGVFLLSMAFLIKKNADYMK